MFTKDGVFYSEPERWTVISAPGSQSNRFHLLLTFARVQIGSRDSSPFPRAAMTRLRLTALGLLFVLALSTARSAPDVAPFPTPAGYKTVHTAKTVRGSSPAPAVATAAGSLGVVVGEKDGKPVIEAVAPDSPA